MSGQGDDSTGGKQTLLGKRPFDQVAQNADPAELERLRAANAQLTSELGNLRTQVDLLEYMTQCRASTIQQYRQLNNTLSSDLHQLTAERESIQTGALDMAQRNVELQTSAASHAAQLAAYEETVAEMTTALTDSTLAPLEACSKGALLHGWALVRIHESLICGICHERDDLASGLLLCSRCFQACCVTCQHSIVRAVCPFCAVANPFEPLK